MSRIRKEKEVGQSITEAFQNDDYKKIFNEIIETVPPKRLQLLWEIMVEADLNNLEHLEEKIFAYGSCLGMKDWLGRLLFARMVVMLRKAQDAE